MGAFSKATLWTSMLKLILFKADPGGSLESLGNELGHSQGGSDSVGNVCLCYIKRDVVKAKKPLNEIP